nr:hypothetical protein CFP56_76692 [Quercus suber]
MGIVAGMLSRAYTHALRNGAARDIANLPNLTLQEGGFSSDLVRQSIGHTAGTSNSGITERYVGGHSADIWHDRVTNPKIHRREPQFAAPTSVTPFQAVHAPDTDDDVEITGSNLSRRTKRRRVLIERTANLAQTFAAEPNSVSMDTLKKPSPHPKIKSAGKPAIESESNVDLRDIVNMDPRLLSEQDLDLLTVRHEEVLAMRSTLLADNHCDGNDKAAEICDISLLGYGDSAKVAAELAQPENDEATRLVLHEPQDLENDTVIVYAHEWVDLFAKYNSVMNRKFAEQFSKGVVDLSEFACLGNSRDPPQLFFFRCQKSRKCPYKSTTRKNVASHERNCDEVTVQSAYQIASALQTELLSCPYDGCDYVTSCGKETLRTHVSKHKWAPRACEHGCDAAIIYNDHQSYKSHLRSKHSAGYPTKCSYPDCAHPTEFTSRDGLRIHLFKTHGLDRDSALPYFPQLAEKRKWKKYQHCPISGCVSKASFKAANILVEHMTKKHNMTPEEAKDYVYENAEFETYVPDIKVGSARKRGPTTQTVVAALNHHNEQI